MFNLAFLSLNDFAHMDGHGMYVWPVYLLTTLIIVLSFAVVRTKIKNLRMRIKNASS